MIVKARSLIADYSTRGVERDRILIKLAATWEGVQAATVLQKEGHRLQHDAAVFRSPRRLPAPARTLS